MSTPTNELTFKIGDRGAGVTPAPTVLAGRLSNPSASSVASYWRNWLWASIVLVAVAGFITGTVIALRSKPSTGKTSI